VHNLVVNALKYAGGFGPIDVTVKVEHTQPAAGSLDTACAVVTVSDRGPGLGDDPDAVFRLFFRAEHTSRLASGTGIGLYVARELVRAMGGEIEAQNRRDGGAAFRFTVPLAESEGRRARSA
jgi:signal transduction histidine kinase